MINILLLNEINAMLKFFLDLETWGIECIYVNDIDDNKIRTIYFNNCIPKDVFDKIPKIVTQGIYYIGNSIDNETNIEYCEYLDFKTGKIQSISIDKEQPDYPKANNIRRLSNQEKRARELKPQQIPYEDFKFPIVINVYLSRNDYYGKQKNIKL